MVVDHKKISKQNTSHQRNQSDLTVDCNTAAAALIVDTV